MVMEGDPCPIGCGFESQHSILDGHFFHINLLKKLYCFFEEKRKEKEAGDGPFKKIKKKSHASL